MDEGSQKEGLRSGSSQAAHGDRQPKQGGVQPLSGDEARPPPSFQLANVKLAPDLLALLAYAEHLMQFRAVPYNELSTTALLFALAQADQGFAPHLLQASNEARLFAATLKSMAGAQFERAWSSYFTSGIQSAMAASRRLPSPNLILTNNCARLFASAIQIATNVKRDRPDMRDLIEAMWQRSAARAHTVLREMGIDLMALRDRYERALLAQPTHPPAPQQDIRQHLVDDRAGHDDLIEFTPYAIAIASFLTSAETRGPISVSIQAPWGAGKSSLMRQVQHRLEPAPVPADTDRPLKLPSLKLRDVIGFLDRTRTGKKPGAIADDRRWTVWFNAWKYESSEQVWAGLVDAIISQVSARLDPVERELFLLRLNLSRIDDGVVRRKIYDRVITYWWVSVRRWLLAAGAAIASVLGIAAAPAEKIPDLPLLSQLHAHGVSSAIAIQVAIAAYVVWNYFSARGKVKEEPAKFSLAEYVRVPDYAKTVGVMHQIHEDLRRVLKEMPRPAGLGENAPPLPLVIFIDDLDRCSPNKVACIVEGINTFLAGDQAEFLFVIGMDPQMVAAALEHAHREVKSHLPCYEQAVPLGWRFMDKFIQLAFTIPPTRSGKVDSFVDELIGPEHMPEQRPLNDTGQSGQPEVKQEPPEADPAQREAEASEKRQRERSAKLTAESADVRRVMRGITNNYPFSPREIKRTLNFVRFVLLLRIGRVAHGHKVPELEQYQRWIVLCIRWPDAALWLQWGGTVLAGQPAEAQLDGIAARRLQRLEIACALHGMDFQQRSDAAALALGLPVGKVAWLADPDLLGFFAREAALPAGQRLSDGAHIGFY
jgi:hypothetical protein